MQVVGIDFGTTNIRLSVWDPDKDESPQPLPIEKGGLPNMPSVIALQVSEDGISCEVGEGPDGLTDVPGEVLVIRNLKTLAMDEDPYVRWHLNARTESEGNSGEWPLIWPPKWWDPARGRRCVKFGGQEFPVWELVEKLLSEAFQRANIAGDFEWRAGCPVHSSYEYRSKLADCLSRVTGKPGNANWVVEEPILFLHAALKLKNLAPGSYLIYDVGGGSFDCALVEVLNAGEVRVFGADGHPLLGGSFIDYKLADAIGHTGPMDVLRRAKEDRNNANPSETLASGAVVTLEEIQRVMHDTQFIGRSASVSRDAYNGAKTIWKRGEGADDPPVGEVLHRNRQTGRVRFVWQLTWADMERDVDNIILFGGTTKLFQSSDQESFFKENLTQRFGFTNVLMADDLLPEAMRLAGYDLAITGASVGACYSWESNLNQDSFIPTYINRLPAQVTLRDLISGETAEYTPFQNFARLPVEHEDPSLSSRQHDDSTSWPMQPFAAFVSEEGLDVHFDNPCLDGRLELTVARPNPAGSGETLERVTYIDGQESERRLVDSFLDTRLIGSKVRLVIDRFGQVALLQVSSNGSKISVVIESPPWQTDAQRQYLQEKLDQDRKYRDQEFARIYSIVQPNYTLPSN